MSLHREVARTPVKDGALTPEHSDVSVRQAIQTFTGITNELQKTSPSERFILTEASPTKLAFTTFAGWYIFFTFTWKDKTEGELLLAVVKDWAQEGANHKRCSKEAWAFLRKR